MGSSRGSLSAADVAELTGLDALVARVTEIWSTRREGNTDAVVLGRYELDREIGCGTYGVVFAAWDRELEREVAVKVFRRPKRELEILREARTLASLRHPNIIALHDIGRTDGFVYLVMDLVDGGTMWEHGPASWLELTELFIQAGRGLAAAHEAGIAHGDVKPSNMLVGRDGEVRVADFGLARELFGDADNEVSEPRGTSAYMAPEQLLRILPDVWSDQFSFCASLWEAIYGCRPWRSTLVCLMRVAGPRKRGRSVGIPHELERVLRRGLSVDPDDRFPSMSALVDALIHAASLADERPSRRSERPRGLAVVVVVVGLVLVLLAWL